MASFVEIEGKKFQNVKDASELTSYSRDYIGRLAREKKIDAVQIGRQWYVSVSSLQSYVKRAEEDLKHRQQKLREDRKRERETRAQAPEKKEVSVPTPYLSKINVSALVALVLTFGVSTGLLLNSTVLSHMSTLKQFASAAKNELFTQTTEKFPVATGKMSEDVSVAAIDFSEESVTISMLDENNQGVLLLPADTQSKLSESEVQDLFSDPVQIVNDDQGQHVVRITDDGKEVRLPFVIVPNANTRTP